MSIDGHDVGWDGLSPIVAHGLLTPVAVIKGFAQLLLEHWEVIPVDQREGYLARIVANAEFASNMLQDLARGLPPDVTEALDALDAESLRRRRA